MDTLELKRIWDRADAAEEHADSLHWQVARALYEANTQEDLSMRELGRVTGRSHQRVFQMIRAHRVYVVEGNEKPPSFNQAIIAIKGGTLKSERQRRDLSSARKILRERPEDLVEALLKMPPDVQKRLADAIALRATEPALKEAAKGQRMEIRRSVSDALAAAQKKSGDVGFALWTAHDRMADEPSVEGEDRVRRLAAIDYIIESSERNARIGYFLRQLVETGEFEAELADLLAEAEESGRP